MRAQVRDFLAERRELTIGDEADPLTLVYRPATFNAEYQRTIRDLANEDESGHKIAVYTICTAVSSWDLTGPLYKEEPVLDRKGKPLRDDYGIPQTTRVEVVGDGKPVPLTSEFVRYVPNPLLFFIMREIGTDMTPDPKSPNS